MLIIPLERKLNWKNPPWLTLALILLNLLVFVGFQGGDDELIWQAVDKYQEQELLALELPVYQTYLSRQANVRNDSDAQEQLVAVEEAAAADENVLLALWLLQDRKFYDYALENGQRHWPEQDLARWTEARAEIQVEFLDRLSSLRFGLMPADVQIADLVIYQFLHGGWGHLIGNMLFLFILGFAVEQGLGAPRFLLAYLLCGVFSGLAFAAMEGFDGPPLVGASGSISGLMGMYVAMYGLQRIRFFYFVGVYFNYFRAPALLMLPIWAGKELWQYFTVEGSNVAYMAHLGGLLAGAGLVLLFGRSWLQLREQFHEPAEDEQEAQFRKAYAMALASIERMQFELATSQLDALWRRHPDRTILLEHLYQLSKLDPSDPAYHARACELMGLALRQNRFALLLEVWEEYQKLAGELRPLTATDHNRVLFAALRQGDLKTAEKAFGRLQTTGETLLVEEACRLLIAELEKRQLGTKAAKYRAVLV